MQDPNRLLVEMNKRLEGLEGVARHREMRRIAELAIANATSDAEWAFWTSFRSRVERLDEEDKLNAHRKAAT